MRCFLNFGLWIFVKNVFNKKSKKSMLSPKSIPLLNKPLEKFRMRGFQKFWSYGMSIRAQTLNFFAKSQFLGFKVFWAHGAHAAPGPAATHPRGATTETDRVTRAAPIANAPRDHIRRAGRFPTPIIFCCLMETLFFWSCF